MREVPLQSVPLGLRLRPCCDIPDPQAPRLSYLLSPLPTRADSGPTHQAPDPERFLMVRLCLWKRCQELVTTGDQSANLPPMTTRFPPIVTAVPATKRSAGLTTCPALPEAQVTCERIHGCTQQAWRWRSYCSRFTDGETEARVACCWPEVLSAQAV